MKTWNCFFPCVQVSCACFRVETFCDIHVQRASRGTCSQHYRVSNLLQPRTSVELVPHISIVLSQQHSVAWSHAAVALQRLVQVAEGESARHSRRARRSGQLQKSSNCCLFECSTYWVYVLCFAASERAVARVRGAGAGHGRLLRRVDRQLDGAEVPQAAE